MLTQKQKDLLLFIHDRLSQGDIAPSFEEMREELGLKSKSGIHRLITALVERGYIERLPHRARALHVKKLPPGSEIAVDDMSDVANTTAEINAVYNQANSIINAIPLCGKIAAGTPIEAIRNDGESIDVPPGLLGRGEHYALTVEGDSMINAGIHDSDTVIIQRTSSCHNGDIVVALIDDQEATLKRFYHEKQHIILKPENDSYEAREFDQERVRIQGVLKTLIRNY